jgi:hypothetical protein
MTKTLTIIIALLGILLSSCKQEKKTDFAALDNFSKNRLPTCNRLLTQTIISDIFSPPVCSRIYAYTNIAAYEALCASNKNSKSFGNRLNGLKNVPQPDASKTYYFPISSCIAFTTVAKKLVFNTESIDAIEQTYLKKIDIIGIEKKLLEQSIEYGRAVGNHIIDWAKKDGYLQRTSQPAYIVNKQAGRWQPTPPDYMDAVETNWRTVRPFMLDSAAQFRPNPPTKYETSPNSAFYKEAKQVYEAVKNPKPEEIACAKFWDCNPNVSFTQGHVMYFHQKISPGGHWVHVAASVCEKQNFDGLQTAEILSKTAISVADAFISCWDAKFTYNLLRPETFINQNIDKEWKPLLQTPAFPEYPSGHSVASASAATMLTHLVGENFSYVDDTEVPFGQPARTFNAFNEAAKEASMSRLYGGIHFLPAIKNGLEQGKKVGNLAIKKLE